MDKLKKQCKHEWRQRLGLVEDVDCNTLLANNGYYCIHCLEERN